MAAEATAAQAGMLTVDKQSASTALQCPQMVKEQARVGWSRFTHHNTAVLSRQRGHFALGELGMIYPQPVFRRPDRSGDSIP